MTKEEYKEEIEMERNGIIPLICKRIICILWKGHNYIPISPEDFANMKKGEVKEVFLNLED